MGKNQARSGGLCAANAAVEGNEKMAAGSRVGTQFGQYQLRALLGRGGMGEVYEAFDTVKGRTVALKLLDVELAKDDTYQQRFRRESHAAARLQEPHVIPIHDWGDIDGVLYIDMRLVPGRDLRSLLRAEGPMDPARAVVIVEQIASALDAAHADGLVHRDVKPENILVTANDFAYLVDFGIAHSSSDLRLTTLGSAVGSYAYMAPERFDNAPVDGRADVYSLACVLHECLTGAIPFPSNSISSAIRAHLAAPVPRPSAIRPDIPAAFDGVVATGLAKGRDARYRTAGALASAARAPCREHRPPGRRSRPDPRRPGSTVWADHRSTRRRAFHEARSRRHRTTHHRRVRTITQPVRLRRSPGPRPFR